MNKKVLAASLLTALSAFTLSACFDNTQEEEISLADVPANIINIVQSTLPGISLEEAERKVKDQAVIYELEGKLLNGKEYEIKISADGTILKVELDD